MSIVIVRGVSQTELRLPAADGFPLAATVVEPAGAPRGAVLLGPATGVKRGYYVPFARFLAESGFAAVAYDYRGVGGSRPRSLRGFRATMTDGGRHDAAGVADWAADRWRGLPLHAVAHSAAGQLLGMVPRAESLASAIFVGSANGYWRLYDPARRWPLALLWHVALPAVTRAAGHWPVSRIDMGEDLPAGVALEWARWCRSPRYLFDWLPVADRYASLRLPMRAYSFEDDWYAPRRAVDSLLSFYAAATVERRHLRAAELGARSVGHFGFFRERFRGTLWREARDFLAAETA